MFKLIKLEDRIVLDASALIEAAEQLVQPAADHLLDVADGLAEGVSDGASDTLDAIAASAGASDDVAAVISELATPLVDGAAMSVSANPSGPLRVVAIASNLPGYAWVAGLAARSAQSTRVVAFDPQMESLDALMQRIEVETSIVRGADELAMVSVVADLSELMTDSPVLETSTASIPGSPAEAAFRTRSETSETQVAGSPFALQLVDSSRELTMPLSEQHLGQLAASLAVDVSQSRLDQQLTAWHQQAIEANAASAVEKVQAQLGGVGEADGLFGGELSTPQGTGSGLASVTLADSVSDTLSSDSHRFGAAAENGVPRLVSGQDQLMHPGAPVFVTQGEPGNLSLELSGALAEAGQMRLDLSVEHGAIDVSGDSLAFDDTGSLSAGESRLTLSGNAEELSAQVSQLEYRPEQGFAGTDTLAWEIVDEHGVLHRNAESIWLQVMASDAPAPQPLARSPLLLSPESELTITADMLSYTSDASLLDLFYELHGEPVAGQLLRQHVPLSVGDVFSQSDIEDGLMSYRHLDDAQLTDGFEFVATDGVHRAALDAVEVRMVGNLSLERNSGIGLESNAVVTLDASMLELAATGMDAQQLLYEILDTPRYARLMVDGRSVEPGDLFSQADLDAGLVTVQSEFFGETGLVVGDSFHFAGVTAISTGQAGSYLPEASFPLRLTATESIKAGTYSAAGGGQGRSTVSLPLGQAAEAAQSPTNVGFPDVGFDGADLTASPASDYARLYGDHVVIDGDAAEGPAVTQAIDSTVIATGDNGVQATVAALNGDANAGHRSASARSDEAWLELDDWRGTSEGELAELRQSSPYVDTLQLTEDDMLLYRLLPNISKIES